jgi:hypothetical protein
MPNKSGILLQTPDSVGLCSKKVIHENIKKIQKYPTFCKKDFSKEEEILNCCSSAYQRLLELRNIWSLMICTANYDIPYFLFKTTDKYLEYPVGANGSPILVPVKNAFENNDNNGIELVTEGTSSSTTKIVLNLAFYVYIFVNSHRYSSKEECGKKDQLYGWLFDTATGNLEVFHNIDELKLNPSINRLSLLKTSPKELTKLQKKQLKSLDILYKISLKALNKSTPGKRDGSIVSVTDKTGQIWTIAINIVNSFSVYSKSTQYVIAAIPECN